MNIKHPIKADLKYVICPLDSPEYYLKRDIHGGYAFVDNINYATKFASRTIALTYLYDFKKETPAGDLVVVPLQIDYSLIEVTEDE